MAEHIEEDTLTKFAAVYAEAVLTFIDSGEAQWVLWDRARDFFDFASVEMDQPETPVLLFVDASWTRLCEVDAVTDPDSPRFSVEALRAAIETELLDEGIAERALKTYLERMEKLDEDGEDGEDAEMPDAPEEDA